MAARAVALVTLLVCMACSGGKWPFPSIVVTETPGVIEVNSDAPDFALYSTLGIETKLSMLRGRPVMLHFWETGCTACRVEMETVQMVYERYEPDGLVVLGINGAETVQKTIDYAKDQGLTYPMLLDEDGRVSRLYGVRTIPTTVLIDREGTVRMVQAGALQEGELEARVQAFLQKMVVVKAAVITAPAPTQAIETTETPTPALLTSLEGCANVKVANVRTGPGKAFPVEKGMASRQCAAFDGRSADGTWLRLSEARGKNGERLWVALELLHVNGNAADLAVVE